VDRTVSCELQVFQELRTPSSPTKRREKTCGPMYIQYSFEHASLLFVRFARCIGNRLNLFDLLLGAVSSNTECQRRLEMQQRPAQGFRDPPILVAFLMLIASSDSDLRDDQNVFWSSDAISSLTFPYRHVELMLRSYSPCLRASTDAKELEYSKNSIRDDMKE
jgi:hypothetical protein